MGIEPTSRRLYLRPNDFEDRGGHQPSKHFRVLFFAGFAEVLSFLVFLCTTVCTTVMLFFVVQKHSYNRLYNRLYNRKTPRRLAASGARDPPEPFARR